MGRPSPDGLAAGPLRHACTVYREVRRAMTQKALTPEERQAKWRGRAETFMMFLNREDEVPWKRALVENAPAPSWVKIYKGDDGYILVARHRTPRYFTMTLGHGRLYYAG